MKEILSKILTNKFFKISVTGLCVLAVVGIIGYFVFTNLDIINSSYFFRTNLFDFLIFAVIIVWLCIKLDAKSKIEALKVNTETKINESQKTKEESELHLDEAEKSLEHISDEIDEIFKKSEINAELVGKKILTETEDSIVVIEDNTEKAIKNNQNTLRNDLVRKASLASIEVAKAHIIEELDKNAELHDKLINESLEELKGVNLE